MYVMFELGWLHRTNSLYNYAEMHVGQDIFGTCKCAQCTIHVETYQCYRFKQLHIRLGQISVKRWHKITCSYFPSFLLKAVFLGNVSPKLFKRLPTVNLIRQTLNLCLLLKKTVMEKCGTCACLIAKITLNTFELVLSLLK